MDAEGSYGFATFPLSTRPNIFASRGEGHLRNFFIEGLPQNMSLTFGLAYGLTHELFHREGIVAEETVVELVNLARSAQGLPTREGYTPFFMIRINGISRRFIVNNARRRANE
jgi:hypothetical protein